MANRDAVIAAFHKALELDSTVDVTALKYREIPQWDSIGHMTLIAELESVFDVMFTTEQVIGLSSFNKALAYLAENGVGDL